MYCTYFVYLVLDEQLTLGAILAIVDAHGADLSLALGDRVLLGENGFYHPVKDLITQCGLGDDGVENKNLPGSTGRC